MDRVLESGMTAIQAIETALDQFQRPFTKREQAIIVAFVGLLKKGLAERRVALVDELADLEKRLKELQSREAVAMWEDAIEEYADIK